MVLSEPVFRSGFVEVRGLRMHVREAGAGEPVLLLHGLGVSGRYFMPLGRRSREAPACGASGTCRAGAEASDRRDPSASAARPTCLPSFSAGALEAQWGSLRTPSAARLPSCLRRAAPSLVGPLTLVGPTVDPSYRGVVDSCRPPGSRLGARTARAVAHPAHRLRAHGIRGLYATAHAALDDRPEERVASLRQPVLVVRGERDAICTLEWAAECASRAPAARLVRACSEGRARGPLLTSAGGRAPRRIVPRGRTRSPWRSSDG